jgi:hypothetical protein
MSQVLQESRREPGHGLARGSLSGRRCRPGGPAGGSQCLL